MPDPTWTVALPTDTEPTTPAEQLADLLDGRVSVDEVSPEIAHLADLATSVSEQVTLVPPTDAFREALRDQVVQAAAPTAGTAAVGTTAATTATGATVGGGGGLAALVAGVAATAVLAASTITVADRAGPGDLLAGLDRGIERAQLAIASDATDTDLLVGFAAERVLEALDVLDTAIVLDLLAQAEDLLDESLALAATQGREIEELVRPYVGALLTLASRTEDPAVRAQVVQQLERVGIDDGALDALEAEPGAVLPGVGDGPSGGQEGDSDTDGGTDGGVTGGDDGADVLDDAQDTVDDATEGVEDLTDEVTDTVDDLTDDVTDGVDDLTDDLTEDVTDTVDDLTDDVTGTIDDTTDGLLGD